jgi:hypothetical protein
MKQSSLNSALAEFASKKYQSIALANDVSKFAELRGTKYLSISKLRKAIIIELSFLQIVNAWEAFLETTFVHYMCGHKTQSGFCPNLNVTLKSNTLTQAFNTVNQGKPYSDWSRTDEVIKRAKIYFKNGQPYYTIANSNNQLEEIRKIRNGIAHSSIHARNQVKILIRQKLGYLPRSISIGSFLMRQGLNQSKTILDEYGTLFDVLSNSIVK